LQVPFGKTLILTLLVLLVTANGLEIAARAYAAQNPQIVPGIASPHRQFEISLARLKNYARPGPVDCIFLGSSAVYRGINPDALSAAYASETGKPLRCFNFGVEGLTASTAGKLARILVRDYHPALLIYGTTPHDYSAAAGVASANALERVPWFAYRSGEWNPTGWLVNNSVALRYYLVNRDWMKASFPAFVRRTHRNEAATLPNGFNPRSGTKLAPDNLVTTKNAGRLARLYRHFAIEPQHLRGLEQLVRLNSPGTRVLIVEMPTHPDMVRYYPNGMRDHDTFVARVQALAIANTVSFRHDLPTDLIPATGWFDLGHLNAEGALAYSQWLGHALGRAAMEQSLR
jgi:hypothetical protein